MPGRKLELNIDADAVVADACFKRWNNTLNERTAHKFRYGILRYCEFTGKMPTALVDEAKQDYVKGVPPWDMRAVTQAEDFMSSIRKVNGSSNFTKLTWVNAVRSFYGFFKIPLILTRTGIPSVSTERYLDIPLLKLEDVRKAVRMCGNNLRLKALILTLLSSGQAQGEIQRLKGKHLKNIVNGTAVVPFTRGKTNQRYVFFIGAEALSAIREYKPGLSDEEYVFTSDNGKKLENYAISTMFTRFSQNMGFIPGYFAAHRFRHYFKTALTGLVDSLFIEYWMGHKPRGMDPNYFLGTSIQDRMLEEYLKHLPLLVVSTPQEVLQKQYDDLKARQGTEQQELKKEMELMRKKQEIIAEFMEQAMMDPSLLTKLKKIEGKG